MIVIEPVGVQVPLQERPRYPGKIILPVLIPPSPEGSEIPLPERKSSLWFWALAAGIVGLVYSAQESPGSKLGALPRKQRGNRLYYMYVPPGKWFEDAISIPKKKLKEYRQRANTTPGALYYIWAESANTARYLLRTDKAIRDDSSYQAILDIPDPPKKIEPRSQILPPPDQLTLFSGRIANETHPGLPELPEFWFWKAWGRNKIDYVPDERD